MMVDATIQFLNRFYNLTEFGFTDAGKLHWNKTGNAECSESASICLLCQRAEINHAVHLHTK